MLIGALIVELHVGTERHDIHPEFRAEAMEMLSDYKKGKTIGHRRITLVGSYSADVGIVRQTGNAEFGFARVPEQLDEFFLRKDGVYVRLYEGHFLFVTLRTRGLGPMTKRAGP